MQTFLPFSDFTASAQALDGMRLGKQRVETYQLLQRLLGERLITGEKVATGRTRRVSLSPEGTPEDEILWEHRPILKKVNWPKERWVREPILTRGWIRHPAKLMWEGHELSLLSYQRAICEEWARRGYSDSCWEKSSYLLEPHRERLLASGADAPPSWLGREEFHLSHRSNLLRKDPAHYGRLWPEVLDDLPYLWPSPKNNRS